MKNFETTTQDYDSIKAIRSSELDAAALGEAYLQAYRKLNAERKSQAMEFGTAFHTIVLQPEEFGKQYVIAPEKIVREYQDSKGKVVTSIWNEGDSTNTKAYQLFKEEIAEKNQTILSVKDHLRLLKMKNYLNKNKWFSENVNIYNKSVMIEAAHIFNINGVLCKSKPDFIDHDRKIIVDLKSTAIVSSTGKIVGLQDYHLRWKAWNYAYIRQQVFYSMVCYPDYNLYLAFVESEDPHNVKIMQITQKDKDTAEENVFSIIEKHKINSMNIENEEIIMSSEDYDYSGTPEFNEAEEVII